MSKTEYWLFVALLVIAGLAFPAYRDVHLVQSIALSLCTGIGIGLN